MFLSFVLFNVRFVVRAFASIDVAAFLLLQPIMQVKKKIGKNKLADDTDLAPRSNTPITKIEFFAVFGAYARHMIARTFVF